MTGNQPYIVSQLRVKRLRQELANAHKKLDEYEELIASLYAIQSLACDKCRTTFQAADPASGQTAQGAMPPPSSTALFHNPYESGESDRSQMLSAHSYPPILLEDSLVDRLSQQNSPQQNSLLLSNVQGSSQIFSTTDHDGRQHLRVPSISSRSSDSDSDGQYLHISLIPPSPSASNSEHEDRSSLSRHHLSVRDARDAPEWSISFGTVKPLIDVKLADVLVFQEMVSCVKFSHDGNYLAVGLDNGHTYIHNMKLEKKTCVLTELSSTNSPPRRDRIWVINFSPNNKYLATGNQSYIVRVWEIAKKRVHGVFKHEAGVSGIDFSLDGRLLLSAAHDGTVRAWSMRDGSCRVYSDSDVIYYSLRRTPDGRHIVAMDYDGRLRIWDFRTGLQVDWGGHDGPATLSIMPDGSGVVTGGMDRAIKYWDLSFLQAGITQTDTLQVNATLKFSGHTNGVRGVSILADGKWVISVSEDLTVRLWDSQTASLQCTMSGHQRDIWWVDASIAGHYFASGGNDAHVAIWRCDNI